MAEGGRFDTGGKKDTRALRKRHCSKRGADLKKEITEVGRRGTDESPCSRTGKKIFDPWTNGGGKKSESDFQSYRQRGRGLSDPAEELVHYGLLWGQRDKPSSAAGLKAKI